MSWNNLDMAQAPQVMSDDQKRLHRACSRALDVEGSALKEYLDRLCRGASYIPGRDPAEVAYYDGIRALASKLIHLGAKRDE